MTYTFLPIDVDEHAETCVRFRRDSFVCSFGNDDAFVRDCGQDGGAYLVWLTRVREAWPEGCVHMWLDGTIIGQIEMRMRDAHEGYIHLFYLTPDVRGTRASKALHAYAIETLRAKGATRIHLSVSPTNARALAYYTRHGWIDCGLGEHTPPVHRMSLDITKP